MWVQGVIVLIPVARCTPHPCNAHVHTTFMKTSLSIGRSTKRQEFHSKLIQTKTNCVNYTTKFIVQLK